MAVDQSFSPVTLQDLARHSRLVWMYCMGCGHEVEVPPASLGLPMSMAVPQVKRHLVCSQCGSRNVDCRPQLHATPLAETRLAAHRKR